MFAATLLVAAGAPASGESPFPAHTVKFIIPFPGGGSNDVTARIAADKLQAKWGQSIVIENKTGAGGNIAADYAAQAEPDGTTLMVSPPGPIAINANLYRHLTYRPEDFVPITVLVTIPNLITVRPEISVGTLADLIALAHAKPGKLSFGSQGNGSTPHLSGAMFMNVTGVKLVHVPYRGENAVVNDMLGGHVDVFFGTIAPVQPFYRDGRLKVLAVADVRRAAQVPDVPTASEAGLLNFISTSWFAVVGPPRLPPALAQRISADFAEVLKLPEVQEKLRAIGTEPGGASPADTAAFIKAETARWRDVIERNNIRIE